MLASFLKLRTIYPGLMGIALSMAVWSAAFAQSSTSSSHLASARESRAAALRARPYGASQNVVGSGQRPNFNSTSVSHNRGVESFESLPPGTVIVSESNNPYEQDSYIEGDFGYSSCDGDCIDCEGGCSDCCEWNLPMVCIPLPRLNIDNVSLWAGVHGAKNPSHLGEGAGFGFEEGLNLGGPIPLFSGSELSYQLGVNFIQSELSGNEFTDDSRDQTYFTAGFFRRVDCGLQGGAVVDYLKDHWYFDEYELTQIRAEISWVYPCNHEIGFMFTGALENGETYVGTINNIVNPTATTRDLYSLFYRRQLDICQGGEFRIYAGATGYGEGVLGGNATVPFNDCWALGASFDYRIPEEDDGALGDLNEGWYVGVRIVWTPRKNNGCCSNNYNRPLFDVANPGSMMLDQR